MKDKEISRLQAKIDKIEKEVTKLRGDKPASASAKEAPAKKPVGKKTPAKKASGKAVLKSAEADTKETTK